MEKQISFASILQICLALCAAHHPNSNRIFFRDEKEPFREGAKEISQHLNRYLSHSFWESPSLKNSTCRTEMELVLREAEEMNLWALKILDATAKLPSGILSGNLNQFGDFDECLSARGVPNEHGQIKGKYCLANLDIRLVEANSTDEKIRMLDDAVHSHKILTNELSDEGHRIPRFETFIWGICVPSSCGEKEIETALGHHLKQMSGGSPFKTGVTVSEEVCYVQEEKEFSVVKLLVKCLFLLIFALTISDLFIDSNKLPLSNSKAMKVLKCFSIKKNWQLLMKTDSTEDEIECIHGARFLNAVALLLSHKQIAMLYNPTFNRAAMGEAFSKSWTMIGRSAILYTDSFVMFSGILASYSLVKDLDNKKGINLKEKLINRFIRFTPNLFGIIFFFTYIMEGMSSGPQWGLVVDKYANLCKKNMWRNFLFTHNYFGFEQMCLTHTHQLGTDMQLFLISPIFVYILWKSPKIGSLILLALSSASTWLRYEITYREKLSTLLYYGISVEQLWRTANLSYILPSHRLTVYLAGLMMGYYLRRNGKKLKLSGFQVAFGWVLAVAMALLAMFGHYKSAYKGYVYDPVDAARFNAFAPILWVTFLSWGLLACVNGYGGCFNNFLCWKYFRVFTKLSYSLYLTQFPVFFYGIGIERTPQFFKGFQSLFDLPEFCVIIMASFALTLTFDLPFQEIKKVLKTSRETSKKDESVQVQETEDFRQNSKRNVVRKKLQFYGT